MGTVTAPAARAAKSAMTHSGRFSERMATRSPGPMPRAWNPSDSRRTVVSISSVEILVQSPSFLTIIRTGFRWVRQDSRNMRLRVVASGPVMAVSFEDRHYTTCRPIRHEAAVRTAKGGARLSAPGSS
jgi:hypothetical protein